MLDIETGKIKDFVKFGAGNLCMVTGGRNCGRVGTIVHQEKHKGSFDVIHVRDATGAWPPALAWNDRDVPRSPLSRLLLQLLQPVAPVNTATRAEPRPGCASMQAHPSFCIELHTVAAGDVPNFSPCLALRP